jgi:hypothetical protein
VSDLVSFQALFARALAAPDDDGELARQPGFAVYRNTSPKAALDALRANYPIVVRLLGDAAFDRLAISHARRHPPVSPVLAEYGASFAESCADVVDAPLYLADVARIDRLWTEAHFAADAVPVSTTTIAGLAEDALMSLSLALHPATRHGWFGTPAPGLWIAHRDNAALTEIDIDWRAEGIMLTRPDGRVVWRRIGADMVALLEGFQPGRVMGEVAADFLSAHPDADLSNLFAQLLLDGALVDTATLQKDR